MGEFPAAAVAQVYVPANGPVMVQRAAVAAGDTLVQKVIDYGSEIWVHLFSPL
jgi:hypothetical protein